MNFRKIMVLLLAAVLTLGMCTACADPSGEAIETDSGIPVGTTADTLASTQPATESVGDVATEPVTDSATEPATEPETEPVTEPETEPMPIPTTGSEGLTYTLNRDGKGYTCTGMGTCTETEVVLDTYGGLPVTAIADEAFRGCTQMTAITIPTTVTRIGQGAFWGCSGLTTVAIPQGVTELALQLFSDCTSLTSLTLPRSLTRIRVEALYNTRLMEINFAGTEAQWAAVTVEEANAELLFATVHYEYQD